MSESFDELLAYIGITTDDEQALKALAPHLGEVEDQLVEDFYHRILSHESTRGFLSDEAQVERLQTSMRAWVRRLLHGPLDEAYFELRRRIGQRHVEIGLPQCYVPLAMNHIRGQLVGLANRHLAADPERLSETIQAVNRALDLEVAIMVESYTENFARQLRSRERLAAIGELAATVSHELKNPLGVVNTSLLLLRKRLQNQPTIAQDEDIERDLQRIANASRRAGNMASQLLQYSRQKELERAPTSVHHLIDDAILMVGPSERVPVRVQHLAEDRLIPVDRDDLSQALANLIRNSRQAIEESGIGTAITVRADQHQNGIRFIVEDDGPGISQDIQGRIFEPLFSTRASGAGLGLSIARSRVEAHQGTLQIGRLRQRGTQAAIWIPL